MYHVTFEDVAKPIVMLAGKSQMYFENCEVVYPTVEYGRIPLHWCNISEDSLIMNHVYGIDVFTMVRRCTTMDKRIFTPKPNEPISTFRNGIHVIRFRTPPKVKSVTDVCEDSLFKRVSVSHLITFDVEKISTSTFDDAMLTNQTFDREADPGLPMLLRYRTRDQIKHAHQPKNDTMYACIFCEKQVNIASDRVNVVLPRGHLCCEDCFNNADIHFDGKCPRCNTLITDVRDLYFVDQYCCACLDARPTTLMLPCCHACTCYA